MLGDVVSPKRICDALMSRLQNPRLVDLKANCLDDLWEKQVLAETGFHSERRADALRLKHRDDVVDALLRAVDPAHLR